MYEEQFLRAMHGIPVLTNPSLLLHVATSTQTLLHSSRRLHVRDFGGEHERTSVIPFIEIH